MNCTKITGENIHPDKKSLLFTVLHDDVKYGVVRLDDETCICARITWNPWSGFRYSDAEVSDDVIALCNKILRLAEIYPEKYMLKGESYSAALVETSQEQRLKISRAPRFAFTGIRHWGPLFLRFIFAFSVALFMCHLFIDGVLSWLLYLFPAPDLSYTKLKISVYAVELICITILFVVFKEKQSPISLYLNSVIPLGTIILVGIMKKWFIISLIVPVIVFVLYKVIEILSDALDMKEEGVSKRRYKLFNMRNMCIVLIASTIFLTGVLNLTPHNTYTNGIGSESSTGSSDVPDELQEKYFQACWDLFDLEFEAKSNQEKIDILQAICDYECVVNFGCQSARVCAGKTREESVLGYYNNTTRTITINADHLQNGRTEDVLDTLLHEIRHHMQHRMVDLYCSVEPHIQEEHRNMSPFREASVFLDNFNDYHSSEDGYENYYGQAVEEDSREWATARMRWYRSFISGDR